MMTLHAAPLEDIIQSHGQSGLDLPLSISRIPTSPLYDPSYDHDACGTGFVANIDGERTHRIVELAVLGVVNLTHRGAVSVDAASGDGEPPRVFRRARYVSAGSSARAC
jgi:hypothetical protein